MLRMMNVVLLTITVSLLIVANATPEELLVQTTSGTVQGFEVTSIKNKPVSAFYGIPYASPPIGDLRFKPPIPAIPSLSIINATTKSNSCLQFVIERNFSTPWMPKRNELSEDCLYLNIYVPSPRPQQAAVMVYLHGGAFVVGSGNSIVYDGSLLASEKGVILVSLNYRLGVFGFLSLDPEEAPGNVGIMDQALAFKWVQDNIAAFGGDPGKVTLFGASAGAGSVGLHLVIPSSSGLFQRGILESGVSTSEWCAVTKNRTAEKAQALVEFAGCNSSTDPKEIIACLRLKSGLELVIAGHKVPVGRGKIMAFAPVVDGVYIPEEPIKLLRDGNVKKNADILLGVAIEDGAFLTVFIGLFNMTDPDPQLSSEMFLEHIKTVTDNNSDLKAAMTKFIYTKWHQETTNWRQELVDFITDWSFTCSTNSFADLESMNGNRVFRYELHHKPSVNNPFPQWMKAGHCHEVAFVFGVPFHPVYNYTADELIFTNTIMTYWTEFAKNGNPNAEGETNWPQYYNTNKEMLVLDLNSTTQIGARLQTCAFIDKMWHKLP